MKAYGFRGVLGLGVLIGAIVFCCASAATPLEENAPPAPSQQRSQANQPNKTKSKQNTNAALKQKQSKNSQKDANSRRQVESRRSERRQEQADLITTAAGLVLSALRKPAPNPTPPPAPVVVKTTPAQREAAPRKRSRPKSSDDDVWSRINPVSK